VFQSGDPSFRPATDDAGTPHPSRPDEGNYEERRAEGRAMDFEQAVEYALEGSASAL
jgi:hypothetical protein